MSQWCMAHPWMTMVVILSGMICLATLAEETRKAIRGRC